jgi:GTP cyclohydrolase-4
VQGILTYREQISGVKQKSSLEHLELSAEAVCGAGKTLRSSGLGFSHITACPCVQETYRNSFVTDDCTRAKSQAPLITHTQRCQTRISLAGVDELPELRDLLSSIDAVVVRNQNTLPREFELLNVHRAHAQPQFLEDVLRNLMLAVYRLVRPHSERGEIRIESVSMESIHDFDMEGEIQFSVKELDQIFDSKIPHSRNGQKSRRTFKKESTKPRLQKAGRKKPGRPLHTKRSPQGHSSL